MLCQRTAEFDQGRAMDWARKIRQLLGQLEAQAGVRAQAIGVSAPGLAAADQKSIAHMPGRLKGLVGLNWGDFLACRNAVPVLNDAHAALLGERWQGAARPFQNVILLTLGTGVGGAALIDGRLLKGHLGRAGHLGHVCLDPEGPVDICRTPGSLEFAMGNYSIRERTGGAFSSTHELVAAFRQGNRKATRIWLTSVKLLACAVCSFINILDPEAVIIGGGIATSGDALFSPLRKYLAGIEWRPMGNKAQILPASLGSFAGAYGAAWNAIHRSR
jgi:glucokinase